MKKNQMVSVLCTASMIISLSIGCGGKNKPANSEKTETAIEEAKRGSAEDAKDDGQFYKLNFGYTLTENGPFHQAYSKWNKAVSKKTGGKLQVEVYPGSQLGVEENILEQMKQGTNVGWQTDAARLGNYVNEFSVLLAPHFLGSMDEVKELMDSPTIAEWERKLEDEHNIKVISFGFVQGYRGIYVNKKATSPDEMKGLQIRTTGAPVWVVDIDSLGCKAVSLTYGEIYNGIQAKVVDSCELPYIAANNLEIQGVAKYILEAQHIYQVNLMVCFAEWSNSPPENYQRVLADECSNAGLEISEQMQKDSDTAKQAMINSDMEYVPANQMDVAAFRKASQEAYDKLNLSEAREAVYKELGKEVIK